MAFGPHLLLAALEGLVTSAVLALVMSPLVVGAVAFASERLVLRRLNYDPEATIVATIGLLYIIQQLVLTFYGPDARPVVPPFSYRILLPWFGYSGYKLAVIAALLIGVSDGVISVFFSPTLAKMIATLAVALVLVFRPQGLFGTAAR